MPYPSQTNPDRILEKAREIVENEGAGQLSLHELSSALGVKAPSLYRYFPSKTDLLRALNLQTVRQMIASMHAAASEKGDSRRQLLAMSHAWRAFAHANPMAYTLAFTNSNPVLRPDDKLLEALAIPIQQVMVKISGEEHSLAALRGLWALLHGFMVLELSGQFRRGGDLDAAFVRSVIAYLKGWSQEKTGHRNTET
jgi:AcrR family transcriptional regulator